MFAPWEDSFPGSKPGPQHRREGRQSQPSAASPVSWGQAASAFSHQLINARVCFQRKGVSGTVSEWKYLHPQELWEWGKKNKQGKTFQGNRGKAQTKESGEEGSSCAKDKQMEETLNYQAPSPCSEELDRGLPLLAATSRPDFF